MTRYRYDRDLGAVVEIRDGSNYFEEPRGPHIIRDIEPYRTVAADVANEGKRSVIGSRSRHRAFLRDNGYVEVGNERMKPRQRIPLSKERRIEDIKRAIEYVRQGRGHELGNDRPFGGSD